MSQKIGYQDGIDWFVAFTRKIPGVRWRPVGDRPVSLEQWYGLEKFERTLRILKDDHDAAIVSPDPPPDPPDPPDPPAKPRLAPMTHYAAPGADARFCVYSPGVKQLSADDFVDEGGFHYTENGLCRGGRSGKFVSVLKPANSMDGLEPCDGYTKDGRRFPPWPPESYEV